jgi:hypothetical protein
VLAPQLAILHPDLAFLHVFAEPQEGEGGDYGSQCSTGPCRTPLMKPSGTLDSLPIGTMISRKVAKSNASGVHPNQAVPPRQPLILGRLLPPWHERSRRFADGMTFADLTQLHTRYASNV